MLTPSGSNPRVKTLRDWDYATLTKAKFLEKYGENAKEYAQPSAPTAQVVKESTVAPAPQPATAPAAKIEPVVFHPTPPIRINGAPTR